MQSIPVYGDPKSYRLVNRTQVPESPLFALSFSYSKGSGPNSENGRDGNDLPGIYADVANTERNRQ
jgi:hypothetical protein